MSFRLLVKISFKRYALFVSFAVSTSKPDKLTLDPIKSKPLIAEEFMH